MKNYGDKMSKMPEDKRISIATLLKFIEDLHEDASIYLISIWGAVQVKPECLVDRLNLAVTNKAPKNDRTIQVTFIYHTDTNIDCVILGGI